MPNPSKVSFSSVRSSDSLSSSTARDGEFSTLNARENNESTTTGPNSVQQEEEPVEVSYMTIPNIGQIFLLCMCRLSEPLAYQSITPYIYFMIRDFGYEDPAVISRNVTMVMTSFSLGQALTAIWWGRFSDSRGRKPTLMLGLLGTTVSIIVFGTSRNMAVAILGRLLCGVLNGNLGVMRTMVAELVGEKKQWQNRAFALLPIVNNIGTVVGPMIGGLLADPVHAYPKLFGDSKFLAKYPYILPNLFPVPVLMFALVTCFLFIEETLESPNAILPKHADPGLRLGRKIKRAYKKLRGERLADEDENNYEYHRPLLDEADMSLEELASTADSSRVTEADTASGSGSGSASTRKHKKAKNVPLRQILTRPVLITLSVYIVMMFHSPTVMQIFPLFLATPKIPEDENRKLPLIFFNGGLELVSSQIGLVTSISSIIGIVLQLGVYPRISAITGNANLHRYALIMFLPLYFFAPYLSFAPQSLEMILAIFTGLLIVVCRTFLLPPITVLINNAAPSRKVLGTVHGLTHSVGSTAKTLGPLFMGFIYSLGVRIGMVALAWWFMGAAATIQFILAIPLRDWGDEVLVEGLGEEEEEEEEDD